MPSVNEVGEIDKPEQSAGGEDVYVFPASFAQQRLWFLDKLEPGQGYNVPLAVRLSGKLRGDVLESALRELISRHEVLRTTFAEDESGKAIQLVAASHNFALERTDLGAIPIDSREDEARRRVIEHARLPFDLKKGPLFRATLFRLADDDHVLSLAFHHIIVDGASMGILMRELTALYEAFEKGSASPLKPLPIQYGDYATWQNETLREERLEKLLSYWKGALQGAPPVLDLPTDFPRPPAQTFNGAHESVPVPSGVEQGLAALSKKEGATLFMTLLASYSLLLSRYSGQEDVVIASPISGRTRAELEPLIGFFVNTLPFRADLTGNPSFRMLLGRVRETALHAYSHQDLPFEKLVEELNPERNLSHNPIVQVMFTLDSAAPRQQAHMAGVAISPFRGAEGTTTKFDLSLNASQNKEGLTVGFTYNVDLFAPLTIQRMLAHFRKLLEGIAANPDCPVNELPLMQDGERQQVLLEWNASNTLSPSTLLHQFVEQQTQRTPDAVALIDGAKRISYRELNSRSNQLARKLQKLGVGPEVLVAVCTERCWDMIVALLAVLKSGGAYVPLDPMYPKDRLAKILEDSHAKVMITQEPLTSILPLHSAEMVFIDRDWPTIATESDGNLGVTVTAENLAYVLFTSGSTGRPKGVALEHRSASIFVQWAQTVFTPEELSGTLFGTSICFDLSIFEMFVPLSVGGTVIIAQNALALRDLPAASEVRLINTVPSAIAELLRMNAVPSSVLTVNLAGEALPESLAHDIYQQTSVRRLYNLYGPTEDTTYSTYTLVPRSGEVTIGRPIANTQAYILDARRQLVPIGVPGELYLAGDGLARGYYGRDDLTAERFVANPFFAGARMYRTGDRCRYRADGTIEYFGRIDNQVKLRGFRIELGEIEAVLNQHESVRQSLAMVREDAPGNPQLVAYVVATSPAADLPIQLRTLLAERLPNYMAPTAIVSMEAFPLTPNGKIDRRALPAPDGASTTSEFVAPRNPTEAAVAAIWSEVLRRSNIGVHDDFFALGGHSLIATQVISRIQARLQRELPLKAIFEHPTVEQLARAVDDGGRSAPKAKIVSVNRAAFRAKKT
jgi:amino acid adenylation domain-containing protein